MCARYGNAGLLKKKTQQINYVPKYMCIIMYLTRWALYYKNQENYKKYVTYK